MDRAENRGGPVVSDDLKRLKAERADIETKIASGVDPVEAFGTVADWNADLGDSDEAIIRELIGDGDGDEDWDTRIAEIEELLKTVDASGVDIFAPISTEGGTKRGDALKFLKAVLDADPDECVLWPYKRAGEYAYIKIGGKEWTVSRLVAALVHGLQPHQKACHASKSVCQSKMCITPKHLRPDTQSENMLQRRNDRTITKSFDRGYSKEVAVSVFYAVGTLREIAEAFSISVSIVSSIRRGVNLYSPAQYQDALFANLDATFGREPFSQHDAESEGLLTPENPVQLRAFIGHKVGGRWRLESEIDCTEPQYDAEHCIDFVLIDLSE